MVLTSSLRRFGVPAALLAVWLTFGSAFIGIKVGVTSVPPFLFAGSRFVLAGTLLLAWSAWRAGGPPALGRRDVLAAAAVGAALILGGQGGVTWVSQGMPPGIVAVLVSTVPLWVALLSWVVLHRRIPALGLAGIVVGFAGVAFLASPSGGAGVHLAPAAILLGAAFSWAAGSILASRTLAGRPAAAATGVQLLAGGLLQLAVGAAVGEAGQVRMDHLAGAPALAWAWLLVGPSLIGFPLFTWLLARTPPAVANTQAYAGPVVALALGWLLLGDPVGPRTLAAAAVILAGVALMVTASGRPAARPATAGAARG